jgi:hypothetical protein
MDAEKNSVLAVARAAPSKHNDSNNLFIETGPQKLNVLEEILDRRG